MRTVLHKVDGGWERVHLSLPDANLGMAVLDYVPRKTISSLAHALILPPTNIGHESQTNFVSEGKLTGSVSKPSAWLIGGHIISPQQYRAAFGELEAGDRYLINSWLSTAKEHFTVGEEDAVAFVNERLSSMDWDEIRDEALEAGGLKRSWKTEPLFRRHIITPVGLAFWRLCLNLGLR